MKYSENVKNTSYETSLLTQIKIAILQLSNRSNNPVRISVSNQKHMNPVRLND